MYHTYHIRSTFPSSYFCLLLYCFLFISSIQSKGEYPVVKDQNIDTKESAEVKSKQAEDNQPKSNTTKDGTKETTPQTTKETDDSSKETKPDNKSLTNNNDNNGTKS